MKKVVFRSFVAIGLLVLTITTAIGQVSVTKVEVNNINSSAIGFYYSLPQTILKIDIVYEKVQSLKGPLSSYADEYLGINDYILSDAIEYNPLNVDVSSYSERDPDQLYFVQFPTERAKDAVTNTFGLSDLGGLTAYNDVAPVSNPKHEIRYDNTYIYAEDNSSFPLVAQYNKQKKIDTILRQINIDTVVVNRFLFKTSWIDKNDGDKAKDAALQIEKIRESRYNLISGYQEINYGSSIVYMDLQLQELEKQYMELFVGKTIKTIENRTIYLVPGDNTMSTEILKFNDGKSIVARISAVDNAAISVAPKSTINNIYYRIPGTVSLDISAGNINLFSGRFTVNQAGTVAIAPLDNSKLLFDTETGSLLKLVK